MVPRFFQGYPSLHGPPITVQIGDITASRPVGEICVVVERRSLLYALPNPGTVFEAFYLENVCAPFTLKVVSSFDCRLPASSSQPRFRGRKKTSNQRVPQTFRSLKDLSLEKRNLVFRCVATLI